MGGVFGQLVKIAPGAAWKAAEVVRSAADDVLDPPGWAARRQPIDSQGGDLLLPATQPPAIVAAIPPYLAVLAPSYSNFFSPRIRWRADSYSSQPCPTIASFL